MKPPALQARSAAGVPARTPLIRAGSDHEAVSLWLAEHRDQPRTLASYRKEAERWLAWLARNGLTLASASREDVLAYRQFLANPPTDWVGPCRARQHPAWRPLRGPLTPASIHHAQTILSALYRYLTDAGYLSGNPFALARRRAPPPAAVGCERFLDGAAWQALLELLPTLPARSAREAAQAARARWLLTLLYLTGARRSEVAGARMGDIYQRGGRAWWRVLGKGGGVADVPLSDELLDALATYRRQLGLPASITPGETTPLVCRIGQLAPLSDKAIYLICRELFRRAAARCQDADARARLEQASCHWLRHTAASHQLDAGVPLLMVSQNLRHASIQTTRRYLHSEADARHEASRAHTLQRKTGGEPG